MPKAHEAIVLTPEEDRERGFSLHALVKDGLDIGMSARAQGLIVEERSRKSRIACIQAIGFRTSEYLGDVRRTIRVRSPARVKLIHTEPPHLRAKTPNGLGFEVINLPFDADLHRKLENGEAILMKPRKNSGDVQKEGHGDNSVGSE